MQHYELESVIQDHILKAIYKELSLQDKFYFKDCAFVWVFEGSATCSWELLLLYKVCHNCIVLPDAYFFIML